MENANLLFYMNLSGEVFYIIAHRMKSQNVKKDLQQRVYNDLAVAICHPTVTQNLVKGSLQILDMNFTDIRTLMDRIVHSSIMTVNAYSMEKLFELTLIATRYQYTVCQYPKDILLIALNHLDTIRQMIDDPVGIQLCENFHRVLVDKLRGESAAMMQEYRYTILTYLSDVKLKMTNLIKLGLQKPTGEFVKEFPDKFSRPELRQPGRIETFGYIMRKNSEDDETGSEGSEDFSESVEKVDEDSSNTNWTSTCDDYINDRGVDDDGCHFDSILIDIHDQELEEDDEILEIEYDQGTLINDEILEPENSENTAGVYTIRFSRNLKESRRSSDWTPEVPFMSSLELGGERGTILGQSIYEIPGNADDDDSGGKQNASGEQLKGNVKESDLDAIDLNAVQGLTLCSIMLGCENSSSDISYKSPLSSSFRSASIEPTTEMLATNFEATYLNEQEVVPQEPNMSQTMKTANLNLKSPMTGINVVKFDARTDRSQNKSALSKISKEFDLGWDVDETSQGESGKSNDLFHGIVDDDS